ncbi:MAG: FecR family protein [Bacteroidales bacterium]
MYGDDLNRDNRQKGGNIPETFENLLGTYKVPSGKSKEQAWQTIFDPIGEEDEVKVISINRQLISIAASVLLIIGLAGYVALFGFGNVEVIVPKGNQLVHFLPDSSKVIINADSKITYNKNRWFLQRNVQLSGEALFRVKKGSRFQVETSNAKTSVLGTIFNVYSRKGLTTVRCIEGRVKVVAQESKAEVILTKGLETKTMGYAMEKSTETHYGEQKVAWTQGDFYFNNTPINSVIEELERQFDVDVFFDGDTNRFYTGYFNNRNLDEALQMVCLPMDLKWTTTGSMIILMEKSK